MGPVKYILVGIIVLCAAFLALACAWYCTKEPFRIRARELRGQIMEGLRGLRFRPRRGPTTEVWWAGLVVEANSRIAQLPNCVWGGAQIGEDQASHIRTIEKHLFAERQLTATLEDALADLESQGNRAKAEVEAWTKKALKYENELASLMRERTSTRYSVQAPRIQPRYVRNYSQRQSHSWVHIYSSRRAASEWGPNRYTESCIKFLAAWILMLRSVCFLSGVGAVLMYTSKAEFTFSLLEFWYRDLVSAITEQQ